MKIGLVVVIIFAARMPAIAHRLDEYLQATILSIDKNRVQAELTLTPGVAVLSGVLAEINTDRAGGIPEGNRRAYVLRVIHDLSLTVDGHPLTLQLGTAQFPSIKEMQNGFGEIRIGFNANVPPGGRGRKLIFENRHQSRIAAYQVNCLVPRDPEIRIMAQNRNYSQSHYELDYAQAGAGSGLLVRTWMSAAGKPSAIVAFLVVAWIVLFWTQRTSKNSRMRNVMR